jgi:SAM-dependent methyltransferase
MSSLTGGRHRAVAALARARERAYHPEPYAGQESFVSRDEVLELAAAAGVARGTRVLDLCCGVGGPGRLVARATGCELLGIDLDPGALALAREAAAGDATLAARSPRFVAAAVPEVPLRGPFEVALLVETFLAFPDKPRLLAAVERLLAPGGRFAFTCEEGLPLTAAERASMPGGDTVWLVELPALLAMLAQAGLAPRSLRDHTAAHARCARRLHDAFADDRAAIAAALGGPALAALLASHARWIEWLGNGRVRKLALVCRREGRPTANPEVFIDGEV